MSSITFNIPTNISSTANNGLTKSGNNIYLGGSLTGDTFIDDAYALYIGSNTRLSTISMGANGFVELYSDGGGAFLGDTDTGAVEVSSNGGGVSVIDYLGANLLKIEHQGSGAVELRANTGSVTVTSAGGGATLEDSAGGDVNVGTTVGGVLNVYSNAMEIKLGAGDAANNSFITDSRTGSNQSGLHYFADYSTNYTNRSLVDKGYVLAQVSDVRLKENIVPIESSLLKINALRPVEFNFIKSKEHKIGFIAQEVEQVFPQLIVGDDGEYLKIKELQLVPYLVKAIQELTQKVNELEKKINEK